MPTLLQAPVSPLKKASQSWRYPEEAMTDSVSPIKKAMTEAVGSVQSWWSPEQPTKEAVSEGTVKEESIEPSEARAAKQKKETFMGGLLGAGVLSPGTLVLCILLL